jgi:hypothetical protein
MRYWMPLPAIVLLAACGGDRTVPFVPQTARDQGSPVALVADWQSPGRVVAGRVLVIGGGKRISASTFLKLERNAAHLVVMEDSGPKCRRPRPSSGHRSCRPRLHLGGRPRPAPAAR